MKQPSPLPRNRPLSFNKLFVKKTYSSLKIKKNTLTKRKSYLFFCTFAPLKIHLGKLSDYKSIFYNKTTKKKEDK